MEKYEYETNGLCGLTNLGNTCFMNSCLQILSHTYELHNEIKNMKNINQKSLLFLLWIQVMNNLWDKNGVVAPKAFHQEIQKCAMKKNTNFIGYNQNDAAEFIIFFFDLLHETCKLDVDMKITGKAVNKKDEIALACYREFIRHHEKDYSMFVKLFYHMSVTTNVSLNTQRVISQRFQSNFILDLPIPNKDNCVLEDCFDLHFQDTQLLKENGLKDDDGKQHDTKQTLSMWNSPPVLIIALKRFSFDGRKNNRHVQFPLKDLSINKHISGYQNKKKYTLYGVCNHSGVTNGGHYTSFVRVKNGNWYLFNDMTVSLVTNIEQNIISPKAYVLFYRLQE